MTTTTAAPAAPPVPHRCPWIVQYFLVSPLRRLVEPPDKLLAPHVREGMTVLEPGCGMGYFSLPIARMVGPDGRLLCVDVEPRALQRLERRARRAGVADRITVSTCGPTRLGLEGHVGQVDLTLVMHALHELEDLPGFLDQIRALLRPDGRMFVVEPDGHVSPEQFDAMMACAEERGLMVIERPDVGRRRLATLLGRRG